MRHIDHIRQAALEAVVTAQSKTLELAAPVQRNRVKSVMIGALLMSWLFAGTAYAQGNCGNGAADSLVKFIDGAAKFVVLIGGAAAGLAMAVGAFFIVVGGTGDKVSKGKKYIFNAVLGLVVLAAVMLIKYVIVNFVAGAAGNQFGSNDCLDEGTGI